MRKKLIIIFLVIVLLTVMIWLFVTPPNRFCSSCYAFTVFNHLPIPLIDIQVKSDGSFRKVPKTHDLRLANIQWLIDDNPEVLVISLGWSRVVKPRQEIYDFKGCKIHLLPNAEAIELFNTLQKEGKRVAIQYHSTC